ncbi:hypothetical protein SAMN05192560_0520 [Methylobacillus rhizosphaerae]|uniref:Uncharacterized protein n=1 Tax=Methylobacillus rhizosphaerae TaxID=551994 RepID=A0A238YDB6_9PROT|nr:hypothetical protein [Methylobacillus rhizosphaerae]SNR69205.1 hypothetical protein SAMN05192560_0520 [Methylobacillus rhizosphaerae]
MSFSQIHLDNFKIAALRYTMFKDRIDAYHSLISFAGTANTEP